MGWREGEFFIFEKLLGKCCLGMGNAEAGSEKKLFCSLNVFNVSQGLFMRACSISKRVWKGVSCVLNRVFCAQKCVRNFEFEEIFVDGKRSPSSEPSPPWKKRSVFC